MALPVPQGSRKHPHRPCVSGLIAHLVEQPAVASDASRFRLQAMADHTGEDVGTAIGILDTCIRQARSTAH